MMVKRFVDLIKDQDARDVDCFLKEFKNIYSKESYYSDVKHSIMEEVEPLGMDTYHVGDIL
jgi:hypothetical protein